MSLRHLVMWTLKDPADAARFKAELDKAVSARIGPLRATRHVLDYDESDTSR